MVQFEKLTIWHTLALGSFHRGHCETNFQILLSSSTLFKKKALNGAIWLYFLKLLVLAIYSNFLSESHYLNNYLDLN